MTDTALQLFRARSTAGQTTVLVFYRGERSFFCRQWLRRWLSIPALHRRLDLCDVALLFVSSQSQGKAFSVADQLAAAHPSLDSRIHFFGDPEHALVSHLRAANLPAPVVTNPDSHRAHAWVFDFGMVQPAVLALAPDAPVYDWAARPSLLNGAGKLDRPDPWDVWDCIERRLDRMRIFRSRAATASHPDPDPDADAPHAAARPPPLPRPPSLPPSHPGSLTASSPSSLHGSELQRAAIMHDAGAVRRGAVPRCSSSRSIGSYPANQKSAASNRLSVRLSPTYLSTPSDGFSSPTVMSAHERDTQGARHGHPHDDDEHADVPVHELSEQISALASGLLLSRSLPLPDSHRSHEPPYGLPHGSVASSSADDTPHSRVTLDRDDAAHPIAVDANCAASDSTVHLDELASLSVSDAERDDSSARSKGLDEMDERRQDESCGDLIACLAPDACDSARGEPSEPLSSTLDNLEVSMASCGSDQVESANVISKHTSLRTVDSAVINTMHYDNSFASGRRIKEEAVEAETGISDYLRELKDPSFFVDGRFILQNDAVQEPPPDDGAALRANTPDGSDLRRSSDARLSSDFFNSRLRSTYRHSTGTVGRVLLEKTAAFLPMLSREPKIDPSPLGLSDPSDPSLQESRRPHRSAVDLSPFADADNDIAVPEEGLTGDAPRDEYEAYDEYLVCEYELEEQVDEYESDAASRAAKAGTDGSALTNDTGAARDANAAALAQPHASALGLQYEVDDKFNAAARAAANEPALTPALESHVLQFRDDTETVSAGAQVRRALRRIWVPRISGSRRSCSRANAADAPAADGVGVNRAGRATADPGYDPRTIARRDTTRFDQRKRPLGSSVGARNSSRVGMRREEAGTGDQVDEETARVSRKETLKSVLKKLPYKNRRRLLDENERASHGNSQSPNRPSSPSRQGTLQAVLQRLPSMHLQAREGAALHAQGSSHADDAQAAGPVGEGSRHARVHSPRRSSRRESVRRSGRGRFMRSVVGCNGVSSSVNEDVGGVTESESEAEGAVGMPSGTGDDRPTDEMVGEVAVRRLESDILTRTVTGLDGMDRSRLSRSIGNDEPSNGRKNSRRRRRDERDEGGERVGAKLSFASVSERILSKFKG